MVSRFYIKCQSCDHLYQIKMQYDTSLYIMDWPIRFECIECNDAIKMKYSSRGLLPLTYRAKEPKDKTELTTVLGYSATLPITSDLYMKKYDAVMSMINFSPYMNLSQALQDFSGIKEFERFRKRLNNNILEDRTSLKELLPILRKKNVRAFSKKMAVIFKHKNYVEIGSYKECKRAYNDMVDICYQNLCTDVYNRQIKIPYVTRLFDFVDNMPIEELKAIKEQINESVTLSNWLYNEAYPYIAEIINNIQQLIPAMFYGFHAKTSMIDQANLNIVTIDIDSAVEYYSNGYEVITHGLPLITGLINILENGDIDRFVNIGMKGIENLKAFSALSGGLMEEKLADYVSVNKYLGGSMERRLRNAGSHNGIAYDPMTQVLECYYDIKDNNKVFNIRLIDVCYKTHIQLLHIIEMALLAYKILVKTEKYR